LLATPVFYLRLWEYVNSNSQNKSQVTLEAIGVDSPLDGRLDLRAESPPNRRRQRVLPAEDGVRVLHRGSLMVPQDVLDDAPIPGADGALDGDPAVDDPRRLRLEVRDGLQQAGGFERGDHGRAADVLGVAVQHVGDGVAVALNLWPQAGDLRGVHVDADLADGAVEAAEAGGDFLEGAKDEGYVALFNRGGDGEDVAGEAEDGEDELHNECV
jgi:hypothetical protein